VVRAAGGCTQSVESLPAAVARPTNNGETCVFALIPRERFMERRQEGIEALFHEAVLAVSPELAETVRSSDPSGKLRAFAGRPGFLRESTGPGWALVGDAGYFRDPITAHGISDALRDAELLARAISDGSDDSIHDYEAERNDLVRGLLTVTDRIASFDWTLEEVQSYHLTLNREMKAGVNRLLALQEH
jgi:2-polyprenyl-6-methoxyphenol hydroxylase-like FAD-dependent oxidoreductase